MHKLKDQDLQPLRNPDEMVWFLCLLTLCEMCKFDQAWFKLKLRKVQFLLKKFASTVSLNIVTTAFNQI